MDRKHSKRIRLATLAIAAAAAASIAAAPAARADSNWGFSINAGGHDGAFGFAYQRGAPRYAAVVERVWIPEVYEDREVCVTIPAVFTTRHVPVYDAYGRVRHYRGVREVLEPARTECRIERVLVNAGYYTTADTYVTTVHRPIARTYVPASGLSVGFHYGKHREYKHRAPLTARFSHHRHR